MPVIKTNQLTPGVNPRHNGWEFFAKLGIIQAPGKNVIKDYSSINNMHRGDSIAVIGSGYSGRGVDRDLLKNMVTIGVNHTIDWFEPNYLLFQDHRFLRLNKYPLEQFPGTIFTANNNPFRAKSTHPRIVAFRPLSKNRISKNINSGLYCRVSSGICALNLALIMGAKSVYLIGCDTPKDFQTWDYSKGAHISENYAGGVETKAQVEAYLTTIPLYKAFQGESKRIINVCENGHIPYFRQIKMEAFNSLLKK